MAPSVALSEPPNPRDMSQSLKQQAASNKLQATSSKRQAASYKRLK
jgi:hypothetical protein